MAEVKFVSTFRDRFATLIEGMTVIEAGERLGISKTTVSAYTTGKRSPKVPVLNSIAHHFNVDPLWLLGMDVPKYKETPADIGEGENTDRAYLHNKINALSDEEVSALRTIVDQVLSLRGK